MIIDNYDARISLADADVILFVPPRAPFTSNTHMGKPALNEPDSFAYREMLLHWRNELNSALDEGKTILVFLEESQEVYADTGKREYSGAGRNRQTTQFVSPVSNYDSLPFVLPEPTPGAGLTMKLRPDARFLSRYWREFGASSRYSIRFHAQGLWRSLVTAKSAAQDVAALGTVGSGNAILLPPVQLFPLEDEEGLEIDRDDEETWTADERQRCFLLWQVVEEIDALIRGVSSDVWPAWADEERFSTRKIGSTQAEFLRLCAARVKLEEKLTRAERQMAEARELQLLLYGTGQGLESAVRQALQLMDFRAEHFADDQSEFDVVFTDGSVRLIGEVEGRDSSAIGIEKLRQLVTNIEEDYAREDITDHAKGVIFGNPQRLMAPDKRDFDFTEKCERSAKQYGFALVLTHSMFGPAAYLQSHVDAVYARACRRAIAVTTGEIVVFPSVPEIVGGMGEDKRVSSGSMAG